MSLARSIWVVLFALGLFLPLAQGQTLKIAAIDWCPQICPDKADKGYIVDTVNRVFASSDYDITIEYFPWSRAIKGVTNGAFHILLSPAKKEAPHLIYPAQPVGYQQMCFFTEKNNPWKYTGPFSLEKQRIGIATDSSIEELNDWIAEYKDVFQFQPYHERFIKQNAGKVRKKRIDSFIFTKNSTLYEFSRLGISNHFSIAGCVSKVPIYAAITPEPIANVDKQKLLQFFDNKMTSLERNGELSRIKFNYGVE